MLLEYGPSKGDSLLRAGFIEEGAEQLSREVSDHPWNDYLAYRLAWAYNRLELPDSALAFARVAWEGRPQDQWYLGEYMRSLYRLGEYRSLLDLSEVVRGGGVCRYYLARAEQAMDTLGASRSYLEDALTSTDDSTAADAASWLSVLLREELDEDSLLALLRTAVELRPDDPFYRSRLAEQLSRIGNADEAWDHIRLLRMRREEGQPYWSARAAYAKARGSVSRELWALRRAWQGRRCPSTARNLGWALYLAGRDTLRAGFSEEALPLLLESADMGCDSEVFAVKAESLAALVREFRLP